MAIGFFYVLLLAWLVDRATEHTGSSWLENAIACLLTGIFIQGAFMLPFVFLGVPQKLSAMLAFGMGGGLLLWASKKKRKAKDAAAGLK